MTTETTDDTDAIERIQTVMRGIAGLIAALDKFSDKREMARAIQVEATALAQFAAELAAAHD